MNSRHYSRCGRPSTFRYPTSTQRLAPCRLLNTVWYRYLHNTRSLTVVFTLSVFVLLLHARLAVTQTQTVAESRLTCNDLDHCGTTFSLYAVLCFREMLLWMVASRERGHARLAKLPKRSRQRPCSYQLGLSAGLEDTMWIVLRG